MARKYGEKHPRAKLTSHDVRLMRQLNREGLTTRQIAAKFDVTQRTAWNVVTRETWGHVR